MRKEFRQVGRLLAGVMLFALTGCSQQSGTGTASTAAETTAASAETESGTTAPETAGTESGTTAAEPAETTGTETAEAESGTTAAEIAGAAGTADASGEESQSGQTDTEQAAEGGTLVVYYSATGNTEEVAGYIADALGADTFEIVPAEPYTSNDLDWTDENSRVTREYEDESLRDVELVSTTVENWDSYDTVFIGYPIWWGIAAWPVNSFVEANDFTGKTVIPFCTSSSSGLGESGELLAELAGAGNWLEGQRFRSSVSEADVADWANGL